MTTKIRQENGIAILEPSEKKSLEPHRQHYGKSSHHR